MNYQRFGNTVFARFDRGEEICECLRALCLRENIRLASVQALGAIDEFTVGVYDVAKKQYHSRSFAGIYEIVSLIGTVNTMDGEYYAHLHMGAAGPDGSMVGGHLNRARISATCEMVVRIDEGEVDRFHDGVTGLNLFAFRGEKRL